MLLYAYHSPSYTNLPFYCHLKVINIERFINKNLLKQTKMEIGDIAEGKATKTCKESGKPIIDGKCVCSEEPTDKQCNCQDECHEHIDIRKILPFIIQNARFYKG